HEATGFGKGVKRGEGELGHLAELAVAPHQALPLCPGPELLRPQPGPQFGVFRHDLHAVAVPEHVLEARLGQDRDGLAVALDDPTAGTAVIGLPDAEPATIVARAHPLNPSSSGRRRPRGATPGPRSTPARGRSAASTATAGRAGPPS